MSRNAIVQYVLIVRTLTAFGPLLVLGPAGGCRSAGSGEPDAIDAAGSPVTVARDFVDAYPFAGPTLQSPRAALAREDGEALYRLAIENDRALREYFGTRSACSCPGGSCEDLAPLERSLVERETAFERQLGIRLDAMEAAVEGRQKQASTAGAEFGRFRALIETLSRDRMRLLRREILGAACQPVRFRAPPGAFFLAYYTAWLRLSRDLPPGLRKEFFTDATEVPK